MKKLELFLTTLVVLFVLLLAFSFIFCNQNLAYFASFCILLAITIAITVDKN